MARRCPRCGGIASAGRIHSHREGITGPPEAAAVDFAPEAEAPQKNHACFDPGYTCKDYPARARDPFWPLFAHPRWLTCRELYRMKR